MLEKLKQEVCSANRLLKEWDLVILTWGNVSAFDPDTGYVVIKPSGVPYDVMQPQDMVVADLAGNIVDGDNRPSSDLETHLAVYRQYPNIRSIVHTHSKWATIWAQMGQAIPVYGTTHADDFGDEIPCTRELTAEEVETAYEKNTGNVILECLAGRKIEKYFGVLVKNHGPFVWEKTPRSAVEKALVLEEVAMMAWHTYAGKGRETAAMPEYLLNKHFERKHGKNAYYGQKK